MGMGTGAWRKTKQGEWVVMADPAVLSPGRIVTVLARSGEAKQVMVARVGRTFTTDDGPRAYGYVGSGSGSGNRVRACGEVHGGKCCVSGGNCSSFRSGRSCGAHCCDGW